MSAPREIARLKVTLEDVEPKVMRRLDVSLKIRLDRLHLVLQAAMGWTNSHLYEFTAGGTGWGVPDPDFGDGPLPAAKTTLFDVIEDTGARTIHYLYDYGDGWDHAIKIERIGEGDPQARYPHLVAAEGRCPPEDVGGPPGYAEFLAAIADPAHEDHDHMLSWCGGAFDPRTPDIERIVEELDRLARRSAPRPRKPKTARREPDPPRVARVNALHRGLHRRVTAIGRIGRTLSHFRSGPRRSTASQQQELRYQE